MYFVDLVAFLVDFCLCVDTFWLIEITLRNVYERLQLNELF